MPPPPRGDADQVPGEYGQLSQAQAVPGQPQLEPGQSTGAVRGGRNPNAPGAPGRNPNGPGGRNPNALGAPGRNPNAPGGPARGAAGAAVVGGIAGAAVASGAASVGAAPVRGARGPALDDASSGVAPVRGGHRSASLDDADNGRGGRGRFGVDDSGDVRGARGRFGVDEADSGDVHGGRGRARVDQAGVDDADSGDVHGGRGRARVDQAGGDDADSGAHGAASLRGARGAASLADADGGAHGSASVRGPEGALGAAPVRPARGAAVPPEAPKGSASVRGAAGVAAGAAKARAAAPGRVVVETGGGPLPGASPVVGAKAAAALPPGEVDEPAAAGGLNGIREQLKSQRRLRVVTLVSLAVVVLMVLPVFFGLRAAGNDPVFGSLDSLNVPSWAEQKVDDQQFGSQWCFEECTFRERTADSQRPFKETTAAYTSALTAAGWQPWKVADCPEQAVNPAESTYTCFKRDEFTLDLQVSPPDCQVDQVTANDPAVAGSVAPTPPAPGSCNGSNVSIKVQTAIADTRGKVDPEKSPFTGETPEPVISDLDPLLEPTPTAS
ncbi:hypothetical protein [Paractinoplanes lichenicola]|uniref:hypothetical protein n=1 Tax=Paractinoplanes lichenicola TaxID=2802976 RepID=UPI0019320D36|nr:hypothetical protein [Actinoplanes lichenicola]